MTATFGTSLLLWERYSVSRAAGQMRRFLAVLALVLLAGLFLAWFTGCGTTVRQRDPQTGVVVGEIRTRANYGIFATRDDSSSQGNIASLVTGGSGGWRQSAFAESRNAGGIKVGDIELTGVIDHSTGISRAFDGIRDWLRVWAARMSIKDAFEFAGRRSDAREATAQLESSTGSTHTAET